MQVQPIEKQQSLSDIVYNQLMEMIMTGKWKTGERIPSEEALSQMLNVSRTTVRDSLRRLTTLGILTTVTGGGTYVSELTPSIYLNNLIPIITLEGNASKNVLEFRTMFEIATIGLAMNKFNANHIFELQDTINKMAQCKDDDLKTFNHYDSMFHIKIAEVTGNPLIISLTNLLKSMNDASRASVNDKLGVDSAIKQHTNILNAIVDKDPQQVADIINGSYAEVVKNMEDSQGNDSE